MRWLCLSFRPLFSKKFFSSLDKLKKNGILRLRGLRHLVPVTPLFSPVRSGSGSFVLSIDSEVIQMDEKPKRCLDPCMKYCQGCAYAVIEVVGYEYGDEVLDVSCMYGLEADEPTPEEEEAFEKWLNDIRRK